MLKVSAIVKNAQGQIISRTTKKVCDFLAANVLLNRVIVHHFEGDCKNRYISIFVEDESLEHNKIVRMAYGFEVLCLINMLGDKVSAYNLQYDREAEKVNIFNFKWEVTK